MIRKTYKNNKINEKTPNIKINTKKNTINGKIILIEW